LLALGWNEIVAGKQDPLISVSTFLFHSREGSAMKMN
jgi:hypothetical protein